MKFSQLWGLFLLGSALPASDLWRAYCSTRCPLCLFVDIPTPVRLSLLLASNIVSRLEDEPSLGIEAPALLLELASRTE